MARNSTVSYLGILVPDDAAVTLHWLCSGGAAAAVPQVGPGRGGDGGGGGVGLPPPVPAPASTPVFVAPVSP